jgi:hypothetical protein
MEVSSSAHRETALFLQAAYCDYQIGSFENFHQLVEDKLIVLRPGPKVFFQYELRFVNCLKSQLLISHLFLPIKQMLLRQKKERKIKRVLGNIPAFLNYPINFCFNLPRIIAAARRCPRCPVLGTFETCRPALKMSVDWGRPEVTGGGQSNAIDPSRTLAAVQQPSRGGVRPRRDRFECVILPGATSELRLEGGKIGISDAEPAATGLSKCRTPVLPQ